MPGHFGRAEDDRFGGRRYGIGNRPPKGAPLAAYEEYALNVCQHLETKPEDYPGCIQELAAAVNKLAMGTQEAPSLSLKNDIMLRFNQYLSISDIGAIPPGGSVTRQLQIDSPGIIVGMSIINPESFAPNQLLFGLTRDGTFQISGSGVNNQGLTPAAIFTQFRVWQPTTWFVSTKSRFNILLQNDGTAEVSPYVTFAFLNIAAMAGVS